MPTAAELEAELRRRAAVTPSMRPKPEPPGWLVALAKWGSAPALAILGALAMWLQASAREVDERAAAAKAEREAVAAERQAQRLRLDNLERRITRCEELAPKVERQGRRVGSLEAWRAVQAKASPGRAPLPLVVESEED